MTWLALGLGLAALIGASWAFAALMSRYDRRHGIDISKAPPREQWGEWW